LTLIVVTMPIWAVAIYMKGNHEELTMFSFNRFVFFVFFGACVSRIKDLQDNLETLAEKRALALIGEAAERERLEREMLDISEREQRRIGQELHDGLCQYLTGTAMVSHVHARKLTQQDEKESARKIVQLVEQAISLARGVAKGLDPVDTQSDGLMQAFEEFSATISELFNVSCRFECDLPVLIEAPATASHLFRIAQEAVSNAIKHGKANDILISLKHTESGLLLSVSDNGTGFADFPSSDRDGMGLRTMATRAKLIGGSFALRQNRTQGVEVVCSIPEVF
jgi:signal transduction histidine kinase